MHSSDTSFLHLIVIRIQICWEWHPACCFLPLPSWTEFFNMLKVLSRIFILVCTHLTHICLYRVRFLLGGRHGEFKFLPPSGYAPCYEALLPKERMRVEPVKEYKRDADEVRDLLGTSQFLSQASFIPTPVDTSQVRALFIIGCLEYNCMNDRQVYRCSY